MLFKVEIELGNEAMESGMDVARALRQIAWRLENEPDALRVETPIMDDNGNRVGYWIIA